MNAPAGPRLTTGHIGLNVSDLQRAKHFYQTAFGFELLSESTRGPSPFAFLGHGDTPILTLWQQSAGAAAHDRPGLHHLAFAAASLEQVEAIGRRLRDLGATIHHGGVVPHSEHAGSGGLFFEDPDGSRLEVFTASAPTARAAPYGAAPTCGFF